MCMNSFLLSSSLKETTKRQQLLMSRSYFFNRERHPWATMPGMPHVLESQLNPLIRTMGNQEETFPRSHR